MRQARGASLALPLTFSFLLHGGAVAALLFVRMSPPPSYNSQPVEVRLVAAPKGIPEIGVVTKTVPTTPPKANQKTASVRGATPDIRKTKAPEKAQTPVKQSASAAESKSLKVNNAEPSATKAKADPVPTVAGSRSGGLGESTVNALFAGTKFGDERYLNNIVTLIGKYFDPPKGSTAVAEFVFDIDRKGCMTGLKVVKGSGAIAFDTEAKVAIMKASEGCAFSPLPESWTSDILNVRFRFDPKVIR